MSQRPASPAVTPFIPPLSTPEGRSPAVIAGSASGTPAWRDQLGVPGGHPSYPMYPPTPYTTTPFIPQMSVHGTPAGPPGSYFPPPINLPPTGPPPASQGLSGDYTGYPPFATPATGWGPQMYPPQQPAWGPPAAPPGPMPGLGGWPGGGGYPPFMMPPHPAGPPPGMGGMHPPGPAGLQGWGHPFATPAAPFGAPPLWPPPQGHWPQGAHPPQGAYPSHESRLPNREQGFDLVNPFAVGKHCAYLTLSLARDAS